MRGTSPPKFLIENPEPSTRKLLILAFSEQGVDYRFTTKFIVESISYDAQGNYFNFELSKDIKNIFLRLSFNIKNIKSRR